MSECKSKRESVVLTLQPCCLATVPRGPLLLLFRDIAHAYVVLAAAAARCPLPRRSSDISELSLLCPGLSVVVPHSHQCTWLSHSFLVDPDQPSFGS
ncbi:hypothetical protein NL676_002332 [Syzygium grande]|nr:hypothetical protein NL676_002332 [Syzygium grande]